VILYRSLSRSATQLVMTGLSSVDDCLGAGSVRQLAEHAPMSTDTIADTTVRTDDTLTAAEAAKVLGVSERTARRYADTGKLSGERVTGPNGQEEWRIYARSVQQIPRPDRARPRPADRATVPVEMYQTLFEKYEGAAIRLGQLADRTERLQLAERSLSTLEAEHRQLAAERAAKESELEAAHQRITELEAAQQRRRWFGLSRKDRRGR